MIIEETFSSYINSMSEGQLKDYLRSVGKAANQRLRELEKQGLENSSAAYRYVRKQAASDDSAYGETKAGQIKFDLTTRGRTFSDLRHAVAEIEDFMKARSSTTGGVHAIYEQMEQTYEKNHGELSGEDYRTFTQALSNTVFRNFEKIFGSEIAIEISNRAKGLSDEELEAALNEAGFYESTDHDSAPALAKIEAAIDTYKANKKEIARNGKYENPLSNANPLE